MANPQTFYTTIGLGKETTWGTEVARTAFLPANEPDFQPRDLRHITDEGLRGLSSQEFDLIPGPGESTFSWDGDFFIDDTLHLIMALMGTDTISGAGDPYTHTFTQAMATPSYTLEWAQNVQPFEFYGSRFAQVRLTFSAADGTLRYSTSGQGKLGATTTVTSASYTTKSAIAGWMGAITVAGSSVAAVVTDGEITLTRPLMPLHNLATTQDIGALYNGPISIAARFTIDFSDTVAYYYYTPTTAGTVTKNAVVVTFTQTAVTRLLTLTMTSAAWRTARINRANNLYSTEVNLSGVYNATDTGSIKIVGKNDKAVAY